MILSTASCKAEAWSSFTELAREEAGFICHIIIHRALVCRNRRELDSQPALAIYYDSRNIRGA
jgi:hypothetical protein